MGIVLIERTHVREGSVVEGETDVKGPGTVLIRKGWRTRV